MKTTTKAKGSPVSKSKTSAKEELIKLTWGWPLRRLAGLLKCHWTHAGNILTGKRAPSLVLLRRLSQVTNLPMQELDALLGRAQKERAQRLSRLHQARRNYSK